MSSALHKRMLAFDHGDEDRNALMEKVWRGTPWMVDAYTGNINSDREREMVEWCRDEFGDEAWPIHGRPGAWQRGSADIYGWTWFRFDTEENMRLFLARFPEEPRE